MAAPVDAGSRRRDSTRLTGRDVGAGEPIACRGFEQAVSKRTRRPRPGVLGRASWRWGLEPLLISAEAANSRACLILVDEAQLDNLIASDHCPSVAACPGRHFEPPREPTASTREVD